MVAIDIPGVASYSISIYHILVSVTVLEMHVFNFKAIFPK